MIQLFFFCYGIYALLSGRYRIFLTTEVKGKPARIGGVILILILLLPATVGFFVGMLRNDFTITDNIAFYLNISEVISIVVGVWASITYVRRYEDSSSTEKDELVTPEELAPYLDEMERLLKDREG